MRLLARLFGEGRRSPDESARPAPPPSAEDVIGPRIRMERARAHPFMSVVGESHYQETLQKILSANPGRTFTALLEREPGYQFDPNAIRVVDRRSRAIVGYLSQELAAEFAVTLDRLGGFFPVDASLHGGTAHKPSLCVTLDFTPLDDLAPLLRRTRT